MTYYALVLDDDPEQFVIIERMLRGICVVEYAPSSVEAFRMAAERTYNLFLVDFHLADITGATFAMAIRKGNKYVDSPIIIYSSDWMLDPDAVKTSGCNDFLRRPFTKIDLQNKVLFWLQQSKKIISKPEIDL